MHSIDAEWLISCCDVNASVGNDKLPQLPVARQQNLNDKDVSQDHMCKSNNNDVHSFLVNAQVVVEL